MKTTNDIPASGYCSKCKTTHTLGEGNARVHALKLMQELKDIKRLDFKVSTEDADPKLHTDYLWGKALGQMFGVLECRDRKGNTVILRAFSSLYNGISHVPGWVDPLLDHDAYHQMSESIYEDIYALGREIEPLKDSPKKQALKLQRKRLSQGLMKGIHQLYTLQNFTKETRILPEVYITKKGIPTGTAECCAPKLLNAAAKKGLEPIGIAEFYWGESNKSKTKHHGEFYSACAEKCLPILGFLLCGSKPPAADIKPDETFPELADGKMKILHLEDDFVVVEKASGFLSVPGKSPENQDSVSKRICSLFPNSIAQPAVHRLDMDTSGIILMALTKETHRKLSTQFRIRKVYKEYTALLDGHLTESEGSVELPFRLDVENRPHQIYDEVYGKMGLTHWECLGKEGDYNRILFKPYTGRTHQLRLHASHAKGLNIPIVDDPLYGNGHGNGQLKLHASLLSFQHPKTHETMTFTSTVPW